MTVVNLTLIDLPGLTKVAVGEFIFLIYVAIWFSECEFVPDKYFVLL
jgi:hypothetical protein